MDSTQLKAWFGQVTTGHGFMILGPTLLAVASGQMTWTMAVPLLVAGVIGLVWPENTPLKAAAQNLTSSVEAVAAAYRAGVMTQEGAKPGAALGPANAAGPSLGVAAAVSLLFGGGMWLAACSQSDQVLACQIDATVQPIAASTLAALLPAAAPATSLDTLLVHPAVVAYCASLGGTPVSAPAATVAPATAVPAAPAAAPAAGAAAPTAPPAG